MNAKYDFKTDENGYLPLIQIRIMQVIMEAFDSMVPLNVDLFEHIKGLDEDGLFSVIENELEMEIDKDKRCLVRTPNDIINLMADIMSEDQIRVYYMKISLINLRRKRDERMEDGLDTEDIDDAIMDLELELMVEENDEAKAVYTEMMKMFDDDSEESGDDYDEEESDEEYERYFRQSLNNIAQTLSVEQIVYMWNEGIELNTLDENDLFIYKEVLAIHGVSVSEMEDADAIDRRLKIQYDVEKNLICCIE